MLDGNIQVFHQLVLPCHNLQQPVRDPLRIAVQHPDPPEPLNPAQGLQKLRQPAFSVQILPIPGGVLGNDGKLRDPVLRKPASLLQHILHGHGTEAPPDHGNGAVGTAVVAALGDFQIGKEGQGGQHPPAGHGHIQLGAEMHHPFVGKHMIDHVNDLCLVPDAHHGVHLGEFRRSLLPVALRQAAGHNDLPDGALRLQLAQLQDRVDCFLLGGLDKAAGVYHHHVRIPRLGDQFIAPLPDQMEHTLRIHQILGTAKGYHSHFNGHACCLLCSGNPHPGDCRDYSEK